jgi:hypothetical protein
MNTILIATISGLIAAVSGLIGYILGSRNNQKEVIYIENSKDPAPVYVEGIINESNYEEKLNQQELDRINAEAYKEICALSDAEFYSLEGFSQEEISNFRRINNKDSEMAIIIYSE